MNLEENLTDAVRRSTKSGPNVALRPRKASGQKLTAGIESTANTTSESSTTSKTSNSGVATRTPFCVAEGINARGLWF